MAFFTLAFNLYHLTIFLVYSNDGMFPIIAMLSQSIFFLDCFYHNYWLFSFYFQFYIFIYNFINNVSFAYYTFREEIRVPMSLPLCYFVFAFNWDSSFHSTVCNRLPNNKPWEPNGVCHHCFKTAFQKQRYKYRCPITSASAHVYGRTAIYWRANSF